MDQIGARGVPGDGVWTGATKCSQPNVAFPVARFDF